MAIDTINIGSAPNDGTGDPLRTAFNKTNTNFLNITADGGDEITVLNPTTSTDTTLNVALQDVFDAGGGGAVSSVNGQTGAVSIDLESVLTEDNVSAIPIEINDGGGNYTLIDAGFIALENGTKSKTDNLDGIFFAEGLNSIKLLRPTTLTQSTNEIYLKEVPNPTIPETLAFMSDITGVSDGDKGDITVSSSGTVWTIDNGVVNNAKVASGIDAVKIGSGNVSNTEFDYLDGVTSAIQTQFGNKADKSTSAYSIKANNTNATADEVETTYRASGQLAYTDTPTFTGTTAPSGAENKTYNWQQIGNWVKATITLDYATGGASITQVQIPMPADLPNPVVPAGFTGASVVLYIGNGHAGTTLTATGASASDMFSSLRRNSGDTDFEFTINMASGNYRCFRMTIEYPTS